MYTLPNPRHETFALTLAQGASPEAAYRAAGFSDNNRKARSHELLQDPLIQSRVAHLKTCLPRIDDLRDRFAPSILLIPESEEEMKAWLWQVMNGTRKILPLQLRAANLFIRLNRWHLAKVSNRSSSRALRSSESEGGSSTDPSHQAASSPPTDLERSQLASLSKYTVTSDLVLRPVFSQDCRPFYSLMADIALIPKAEDFHPTHSAPAQEGPIPFPQSSPVGPQLVVPNDKGFATPLPEQQDKGFRALRSAPAKDGSPQLPKSAAQSSSVAPQLLVPETSNPTTDPDSPPPTIALQNGARTLLSASSKSPNGDKNAIPAVRKISTNPPQPAKNVKSKGAPQPPAQGSTKTNQHLTHYAA